MQPTGQEDEQKRLSWLTEIYNRYVSELQRYIFTKVKEPFLVCSFCGRSGSQVKRIFPAEGPTPSAHICNDCVESFHAMLA